MGGSRENKKKSQSPGVKAIDGAAVLERKQVRLDATTQEILVAVGGGNLSLGIREAARRLKSSNNAHAYRR